MPIPGVKTVLILALICATPYGARRGYNEYLRREEAAPKITVYLNQNCYGENILLTLQDGFDMETKRASGRGYELCKITFPEGMNANDQVRQDLSLAIPSHQNIVADSSAMILMSTTCLED